MSRGNGWKEKEGVGRAQIGWFVLGLLAVEVVVLGYPWGVALVLLLLASGVVPYCRTRTQM